ncbi:MAG: hypothetical protein LUH14_05895 [Clostridiaceae bacterium]|nr:hypothetical protein [Clostridiaceae bacterium]
MRSFDFCLATAGLDIGRETFECCAIQYLLREMAENKFIKFYVAAIDNHATEYYNTKQQEQTKEVAMMAPRKSDSAFPGCVKIGEPDFESLSVQTKAAQGCRSLNAFAEDCGVNASTLSRIINKKITSPCTEAVAKAIASNAEEDSGVTYETLITALGMAKVDIEYRVQSPSIENADKAVGNISESQKRRLVAYQESMIEATIREIIQNELLMRGYMVSVERDAFTVTTSLIRFRSDFTVKTDALDADGINQWAFEVNSPIRQLESNLMRLFTLAYVDSPEKKHTKISLVTTKKAEYYDVLDKLDDVRVHDDVSLILVDTDSRKVVDEYLVQRYDGKERIKVFMVEEKLGFDRH